MNVHAPTTYIIEHGNQSIDNDDNDNDDEEEANDIDIQTHRNPLYLLWLVVGIAIGLACMKLTFATVQFGDPLDNNDPHQWYVVHILYTYQPQTTFLPNHVIFLTQII